VLMRSLTFKTIRQDMQCPRRRQVLRGSGLLGGQHAARVVGFRSRSEQGLAPTTPGNWRWQLALSTAPVSPGAPSGEESRRSAHVVVLHSTSHGSPQGSGSRLRPAQGMMRVPRLTRERQLGGIGLNRLHSETRSALCAWTVWSPMQPAGDRPHLGGARGSAVSYNWPCGALRRPADRWCGQTAQAVRSRRVRDDDGAARER